MALGETDHDNRDRVEVEPLQLFGEHNLQELHW